MPFRNIETHFSQAPQANVKRSSFKYNKPVKTTFNAGDLVPFLVDEVLPGDTFDLKLSKVVRLTTSIHPTMDNLYLDTYFFFVPNRFIWDNWTHFMGESDKAWTDNVNYVVPTLGIGGSASVEPQSIINYLGIPAFEANSKKELKISLLPLNAYIKVWNDWFRSENLIDSCPFYTGDGDLPYAYWESFENFFLNFGSSTINMFSTGSCLKVAKFADYFTRALPQPQKGADVLIPAGGNVVLADDLSSGNAPYFQTANGGNPGSNVDSVTSSPAGLIKMNNSLISDDNNYFINPNGSMVLNGLEITVNNLRLALQTQRLLERDARGGTRYIELIKSHFNVVSPDLRLQRSEYLGGKRTLINMTDVIQTSETSTTPLGHLGGRSLTTGVEDSFIKSFTEHGYIVGVMCVRPDRTYSQGIEKLWTRFDRLDYYYPVLANIGEMGIKNKEIYLTDADESDIDPDDVFGYQEAWSEYRTQRGRNTGYMQPGISGSLASWTYGDNYTSTPKLSSEWLYQGKNEIDATLAVSSAIAPQFIADMLVYGKVVRPMPVYSIPGLVDHN